jgi:hypothetical protein
VIELLDFNLRGGRDAPSAAARVARITERYLTKTAAHDIMAVVNEIVAWLGTREPMPRTLRLELSVTSTVVRVSVTAAPRRPASPPPTTNRMVRQTLPVTAALASRYGLEASRRTRVWAEFDRCDEPVAAYTEPQYSS